MITLTDIAIEHTYSGEKAPAPMHFTMHPYPNSRGSHAGRFEIFRDIKVAGRKKVRRSAHVTAQELAELYARGLVETFSIHLRLRPSSGVYPDSHPGKRVPRSCIVPGSCFDRDVKRVRVSEPMSPRLRDQMSVLGL